MPYKKNYGRETKRGLAVRIMLANGLITSDGIRVLSEDEGREYQRMLKRMKDEGLVGDTYVGRGSKGWYLSKVEKEGQEYLEQMPNGYYGQYKSYGQVQTQFLSLLDHKDNRRIRAINNSDVATYMIGTDINVLPDEKTLLTASSPSPSPPAYYTFAEVKTAKGTSLKSEAVTNNYFVASRALGVYTTTDRIYPVYLADKKMIRFLSMDTEDYAVSLAQDVISQTFHIPPREKEDCILLAKNDDIFEQMMFVATGSKGRTRVANLFTVEQSPFNKIFALPYGRDSEYLIQRMAEKEWEENILTEVIPRPKKDRFMHQTNVTCDGVDANGTNEFVFCIPDIIRFKRFVNTARRSDGHFRVYCYSWQTQFVRQLLTEQEAEIVIVGGGA